MHHFPLYRGANNCDIKQANQMAGQLLSNYGVRDCIINGLVCIMMPQDESSNNHQLEKAIQMAGQLLPD